jgi:hypothetical protein
MKKSILIYCLTFSCLFTAAQNKTGWQHDVRFLKTTISHKYPNLYYNITQRQFDSAADDFIQKIPGMQEYEFQAGIGRLMAMFRVGHTQAGYLFAGPRHGLAAGENKRLFGFLPVSFYLFSDGLYIKAALKKHENLVGAKITHIGIYTAAEAMEKLRPYVNYENEQGFKSNVTFYLRFPKLLRVAGITSEMEELTVKLVKNGKEEAVEIAVETGNDLHFGRTGLELLPGWTDAAGATNPIPYWRQAGEKFRNMIYLSESKICYLRHSVNLNEDEKTMKDFFEDVYDFIEKNEVEKFVLDLRMNGGGNNQLNKPVITGIIRLKKINQKGKFFCIIGRRTFSAAQNLVNELEKYTEVTFVGEPTSENVNFYGDTRTETLPNSGLQVFCSWLWWQNSDPRDHRKATSPHLAVDMSFSDYATNTDPVMTAIENYRSQTPLGPAIKELELQHKHAEAMLFAQRYFKDPVNRYYLDRMETEINEAGYDLLNQNKMQEAKNIFEINCKLFPQSGNTYDSYAECCLKMNLNEEAKLYYQKAITAEPGYPNAEEAAKVIIRLSR